jgi:gas vesicle protein
MNFDRGYSFIGGFVVGGIVGAAVALLMAPASGQDTREQIRSEGVALKQRGEEFGNDRMHDAQKMVKQGQKGVSDAQARLGGAIQDQKEHLQEAIDTGKHAASQRKDEILKHFDENKASQIETTT